MSEVQHLNLSPGLHPNIDEKAYHNDLLRAEPTLSRSEAVVLLDDSPLHLWCSHPRLGARNHKPPSDKMDFGSGAHAMVLGSGQEIEVVDADDWKTKDARAARDSIRAANKIPMLTHNHARALEIKNAFFLRLGEYGLREQFEAGVSESTIVTDEGSGAYCRVRLDRLFIDEKAGRAIIFDPKFCESANPTFLPKQVMNMGYVVQEAYYRHAFHSARPDLAGRERFIYLFQEDSFPYAMTPAELNGEFQAIGMNKIMRAIDAWKRHLGDGRWPSYAKEILKIEPPSWALPAEIGAPNIR